MGVYRARESFAYWDDRRVPHDVPAGTLIDSDKAPFFKGREHLFEEVEEFMDRAEKKSEGMKPVESATAAPGEKRSISPTSATKKEQPK